MKLWITCWSACLCACTAATPVPLDGRVEDVQESLPATQQDDSSRADADAEAVQAYLDASAPMSEIDAATPTTPEAPSDAGAASGACDDAADRAVIDASGVDALSCEGAACIARSLSLGAGFGIDEGKAVACMENTAPTLSKLSAGCRDCFVEVSLCVPQACVAVLGGTDACRGLPNSSFAACDEPSSVEASCTQCQAERCYDAFVECSGVSR